MKSTNELQKELKGQFSKVKLVLLLAALVLLSLSSFAQTQTGFGLKGGLNYTGNGDYFESIGSNAENPDRNIGYHIGVFGKIGQKVYLRPELVYTKTKSDYRNDSFEMSKLDAPILVGLKVLGPISVFAGPSFQYILDSEFDNISINNIENDFSVGLNFGIGLNLKKLGIDLRYERGFSDNEATFINNNIGGVESRLDTRSDQLILSLSLLL
ncbi:Outer membrane protein beta-barrel domain-containing protein [Hyunsoonleella jejuensis]|uniref:Outer membrane protein beta-barrel domain-containing protein n=1 Tax=Hyunsoonleella jejuensis TaxID=419940 RepID=A0A1H9DU45_9FLAO|nr:outer membrane beta-barrel protein [Hyunsoonleella jejuensis]SEQ16996.1 Outer membrane protein beta-barrel domain-containing protein [Hyunsoonleella jejuensis]